MADPKKPADDDDEPTSISIDLTPPAAEKGAPSLADDDDEEPTKVLDWDRAMKKSLEDKNPRK